MSYYVCSCCGEREAIFGAGGAQRVSEQLEIPLLGDIPLSTDIRVQSDRGRPIVLDAPESLAAKSFVNVAENLAAQISIRTMSSQLNQEIQIAF